MSTYRFFFSASQLEVHKSCSIPHEVIYITLQYLFFCSDIMEKTHIQRFFFSPLIGSTSELEIIHFMSFSPWSLYFMISVCEPELACYFEHRCVVLMRATPQRCGCSIKKNKTTNMKKCVLWKKKSSQLCSTCVYIPLWGVLRSWPPCPLFFSVILWSYQQRASPLSNLP